MDNQGLKKCIRKLNEDITNLEHQIGSIYKDIEKHKKQSDIEKRIDRLINKYKEINEKYKAIAEVNKKEVIEIQKSLEKVTKKVELVCRDGSKDKDKQNTKLDMYKKESKYGNSVGIPYNEEYEGKIAYDDDGEILFFYTVSTRKSFFEKIINKIEEITKNEKEVFFKNIFSKTKEGIKNIFNNKMIKRVAALGMGALMLLPTAKALSQQHSETESENNKSSYTDDVKETPISTNPFIEAVHEIEETRPSTEIKTSNETNMENEIKSEEEIHIIAPAQCRYTEVSDGSGQYGIFDEETEVAIYNRALIRSNKDGSKSILKATKIGQTWEQYAEEQGLDYNEFKEYIENNENIQEVISTMSVDGKNIYGWIPASDLRYRTQSKNMEVERNYVTELEER